MKIVIVGGVAAGMSAAARARRLSEKAEIVVLERSQYVSFANCGLPYHIGGDIKDRDQLLLQTPQTLAENLNLDVRTGHEVISIDRSKQTITIKDLMTGEPYHEAYDKLVLCPGASPIRPKLPGINHPRIFTLRNIEDMDVIKAIVDQGILHAVVVGGGYIGVEMAESLRNRGVAVTLVELADQIMPPLDQEMARDLQYHLEYHSVQLKLGTAAVSFDDENGNVHVTLQDGTILLADIVLLAVGVRPDAHLARQAGITLGPLGGIEVNAHMQTSDPNIYAAGDVVEVMDTITGAQSLIALAGPANRQGRIVAEHILGRKSAYSSTQGTAIVKVFEMTGGVTGASEKLLKSNKLPYHKVYIHPSGHASYYPGSTSMHIKLLFAPGDGKILGAQVVGYDGVDKRIDIFATAIRAGLTVYDLEELELAYAPPYGSAKDPVNMAGFVAANLLKGDVNFWYAEDYPAAMENGLTIDVRSANEFKTWHIPGAINTPLGQLRTQLDSLPKDKPIFLYCRVGFRSYLAYRILVQSGFNQVKTLAGGSKTFCSFHRTPLCTGRPGIPFVAHAEEQLAEQAIAANCS
ncbi:FAD-dependent oxidoreductase [Methylotenera sp.]|uniref:FAD-dependent oxidoreductase n=1 Tax=Methylotenera sp. TaxID=2051956 RepID=UPI0027321F70|nr:FAD-dependent oxidoreductase [Methylotenera sp.]MDP1523756.1 FAD-dependent oxidoreductase [Methylotenera sp.]MDP2070864.1 FAD-dependent oxidoreductase [Methylotenera sp.]MDP2230219.1 FAD-dependent oxidoreductase [Methylotenera sp.]MDP3005738.1 FAD-dependent oxidoreductase [Methylotenera sp.]MDP3140203.1 FAD-dependent oxidoreductase [Methylotenera sp.]